MKIRSGRTIPWRVGWESIRANRLPMVVLGAFWSLVGLSSGIRLAQIGSKKTG